MVNLFAELYEVISSSQYISRFDQFFILSLFIFFRKDGKSFAAISIRRRKKKGKCQSSFFILSLLLLTSQQAE